MNISLDKNRFGRALKGLELMLILQWALILRASDAHYCVYVLCGLLASASVLSERSSAQTLSRRQSSVICTAAVVFAAAVALANYPLMTNAVNAMLTLCGGFVVGRQILLMLDIYLLRSGKKRREEERRYAYVVFLLVFLFAAAINFTYLFVGNYPGTLTPDSLSQIEQILAGKYSNHHPYWHTKLIEVFVKPGMLLFGDINAAIAVYSAGQIVLMAVCFAFAVMTLYQAGATEKSLVPVSLAYLVMPYHIVYSTTMWKDVLFGGAMLLTSVSLLRVFRGIGNKRVNVVLLCAGFLGTALLRSNGFLVLAASFVFWLIFFGRKKKIVLAMASILVLSWIMKTPVLDALGVERVNFRESISIPIQQVARVFAHDGEVTQEQKAVIDRVIDVEQMAQLYLPYISDPVKAKTDGETIRVNKGEYLKIWIEIGLQNPVVYVEAWVEQTKGYWNGGYDYWCLYEGIPAHAQDTLGLQSVRGGLFANKFSSMSLPEAFGLFFSIGLHVWLFAALFVIHLIRGRREMAYLAVPVLMMIGTLMVATPVFCEFRYAYGVFTVLPFYATLSFNCTTGQT